MYRKWEELGNHLQVGRWNTTFWYNIKFLSLSVPQASVSPVTFLINGKMNIMIIIIIMMIKEEHYIKTATANK